MINLKESRFDEENIRSEYLRKWLNLLCNTKPRYEKFINQFKNDGNLFHSACSYQKYLREAEGRGKDIGLDEIEAAITNGDINELGVILQELFIEPIDAHEINYLINLIEKEGLKVSDIYNLHEIDKDRGFWLTVKKMM